MKIKPIRHGTLGFSPTIELESRPPSQKSQVITGDPTKRDEETGGGHRGRGNDGGLGAVFKGKIPNQTDC